MKMKQCNHQNIDITEVVTSRYTHHVRQGSRVERSTGIGVQPRQFDVHCLDCEFTKSYRYGPGAFGPDAKPRWLYQSVDRANGEYWSGPRTPSKKQ